MSSQTYCEKQYSSQYQHHQSRLTVSQLFSLQLPKQITQNLSISRIFFTSEHVFIMQQNKNNKLSTVKLKLKKIKLKTFQLVEEIQILGEKYRGINKICEIGGKDDNFIVFCIDNQSDVYYKCSNINIKGDTNDNRIQKVQSHMDKINDMTKYKQNFILTCSDDLTIRLWQHQPNHLHPYKPNHIIHGHSKRILCLQFYQHILISGSQDRTVRFYNIQTNHTICISKHQNKIVRILACGQSQQVVVVVENSQFQLQMNVIDMKILLRDKHLVNVVKKIKYNANGNVNQCYQMMNGMNNTKNHQVFTYKSMLHLYQIDDSFVVFSYFDQLVFVQINLGKILYVKYIQSQQEQKQKEKRINKKSIIILQD